jgi:ATP-dependent helicase/nuclease subunit B
MLKNIPTVFNIPAGVSFFDCLAQGIIQHYNNQPELFSKITIFLPSKQNIKTLKESFFKINHGKILLLPKIRSLGDMLDNEMSLLPDIETSPYAILSQKKVINYKSRHLALTRFILETFKSTKNANISYQEGFSLAATLLELLDSLQLEQISPTILKEIKIDGYIENWQKNLDIINSVTELWTNYLVSHNYCDPIIHRNAIFNYLSHYWLNNPSNAPVIIAGSIDSTPASAHFIKSIGCLEKGCIVLSGLDTGLTEKDIHNLNPNHPQYELYKLIHYFGNDVASIENWTSTDKFLTNRHKQRQKLCHEIMRSSETTESWINIAERLSNHDISQAIQDINIIHAPNERKEASAIALIIREAMETPNKSIALVTPNRLLVQRVKAILTRWNIIPNDSAGIALSSLPQGIYFKLLCDVLESNFAPIQLLSFLKHPFSNAGFAKGDFKTQVYRLEKQILRGVAPSNGLQGYRQALKLKIELLKNKSDIDAEKSKHLHLSLSLIDFLERLFSPIIALDDYCTMTDFTETFINLINQCACTDTQNATELFWSDDAGQCANDLLSSFIDISDSLGFLPKQAIYNHIKEFSAKTSIHKNFGYDKNVFIWGTSEARLQQADIMILAGLTEGSWPVSPQANIWLSRPMQEQLGLTTPERHIGLSAHEFVQAICSSKIFLTYSAESNGSPNIPSRWIISLENIIQGVFTSTDILKNLYNTPYLSWLEQLDNTDIIPIPAKRPMPKPPINLRPKAISVTDAEKWLRDPYTIYCKHILNLKKLNGIDEELNASEKGTIIHKLFNDFTIATQTGFHGSPEQIMNNIVNNLLESLKQRPLLYIFWGNRLHYICTQFVEFEIERRKKLTPILSEIDGKISFQTTQGDFTIKARCDRIDLTQDNQAIIVDYKTSSSSAPSYEQMKIGLAPQLPLQAIILEQGGFGKPYQSCAAHYIIVNETKNPPFEIKEMKSKQSLSSDKPFNALIHDIFEDFKIWVEKYNDINTAYISRRLPQFLKYEGDYDHLARVKEWVLNEADIIDEDI